MEKSDAASYAKLNDAKVQQQQLHTYGMSSSLSDVISIVSRYFISLLVGQIVFVRTWL
jgi:hypothetical protein